MSKRLFLALVTVAGLSVSGSLSAQQQSSQPNPDFYISKLNVADKNIADWKQALIDPPRREPKFNLNQGFLLVAEIVENEKNHQKPCNARVWVQKEHQKFMFPITVTEESYLNGRYEISVLVNTSSYPAGEYLVVLEAFPADSHDTMAKKELKVELVDKSSGATKN